ncbi:hypothetical protein MAM1_0042c02993 [Mucor ambiguus]|uniref:Uncharacterized protein n=1 Tax=Mucor ambiguus TaxID=91626 RepID=A0A0C9MNF8_9FUNG|nr:hypothetical protein MAM1_0042c02993 [Mucor ambiguus]
MLGPTFVQKGRCLCGVSIRGLRKVVSDKAITRQKKRCQMGASTNDSFVSADEYKLTVTFSSCFHRPAKQVHVRNGRFKRIPGTVVCSNVP